MFRKLFIAACFFSFVTVQFVLGMRDAATQPNPELLPAIVQGNDDWMEVATRELFPEIVSVPAPVTQLPSSAQSAAVDDSWMDEMLIELNQAAAKRSPLQQQEVKLALQQSEPHAYRLSIQKLSRCQDEFKVKISKKPKGAKLSTSAVSAEKCSFVANFAKHVITQERNSGASFNITQHSSKATFADSSNPDCLLWDIPNFGLIKVGRDGSVFFGHGANEAPLATQDLVLKTSGKLFLQSLKVASLTIQSQEAQLGEAVVSDRLHIDHFVQNTGGLRTKHLTGSGELLNQGMLELEGTQQNPAILSVKKIVNKKNKLVPIEAAIKGSHVAITDDNHSFLNGNGAHVTITDVLTVAPSQVGVTSSFVNKGSLTGEKINLLREASNAGFWQAHTMTAQKPFSNKEFGQVKILGGISLISTLVNDGNWEQKGDFVAESSTVQNNGSFVCRHGNLSLAHAKLTNAGNWLMDTMKCSGSFDIENKKDGTLQLKNSSLDFGTVTNSGNLLLYSGVYTINTLRNSQSLQLLENNWTVTENTSNTAPHRLVFLRQGTCELGKIECQANMVYDMSYKPSSLHAQGDIQFPKRHLMNINTLSALQTSGKVTAWCDSMSLSSPQSGTSSNASPFSSLVASLNTAPFSSLFASLENRKKNLDFPNIGHLELFVNGTLTLHSSLKAPTLSLHIAGPLILGKDNEQLGTIAATHGPLTVTAHNINGSYGKFYGKGATLLESTQGDIIIGAPTRGIDENIKQQYIRGIEGTGFIPFAGLDFTLNQMNGAYAASDNQLTLRSAANIFVKYGTVMSVLRNNLIAKKEVLNLSGKISSQGSTAIEAVTYNHLREGAVHKSAYPNWAAPFEYPGSGPAVLESLKSIDFLVKNVCNRAGSIRCGEDITINGSKTLSQAMGYVEEPQHFYTRWFNQHGRGGYWGHQANLILSQSCVTQAGGTITLNLGDLGKFAISGSMNAGNAIAARGNTGAWGNSSLSRQTVNATQPIIADVTHFAQEQARRPGIFKLGANNSIQTEFPIGAPSRPANGDVVLLENPAIQTPLNWRNFFNPLSGINLDLHVQQLLGNLAGRAYAGKAKGNGLATVLWANANKWRQEHGTALMSLTDLQKINQSMLLTSILNDGATAQQQILLCIAPGDINPFQSSGDVSADAVSSITTGNQTMSNNRVVATGPAGIDVQSTEGKVTLETQKYTVSHETRECRVIEERAMPQQQLIASAGPLAITGHDTVTRTGTLMAAATNVTEKSQTGAVIKNPLVLQKLVETRHEKRGLFSNSTRTETSLSHSAVTSVANATLKLHNKAATSIDAVAPQDSAGQEIVYEAPHTTIEGLLVANRATSSTQTSGLFSEQETHQSKETPFAVPAVIQAPLVRFVGHDATVNANIHAHELRDETEHGAQFVAKIAQMLCSEQTLISSPLCTADVGYKAGYETMIAPMLMVEKIVRAKDAGQMVFESAIIDKDRTQIIGKFVETTYQLKQWQTSWSHIHQVISDEALVVVALAIVLVTQGMGVEMLAPLMESVTAATGMQLSAAGIAMVNAGFTTLCSSAGTSLLRTGDPIKTLEGLASPAQLKSLAFSMASAGLCSKLGGMLDVNMTSGLKSLTDHFQEQALRSTVDTLLHVAISHAPVDTAVGDAFKQIPIKAVAAYAANQICDSYMDTISQKTAQTLVGGLSGYALDQSRDGFVAGATGALTAEIVGDALIADAHALSDAALAKLRMAGKPLTLENIQQAIAKEVQTKTNRAKIAAGGVAVLTHQNPSIAIATATNALDNDVAIRGSIYAFAEFQALLTAASQAIATLHMHEENVKEKPVALKKTTSGKSPAEKNDAEAEAARDLLLQSIQRPRDTYYEELILEHAQEQLAKPKTQKSVYNQIVDPKKPRFVTVMREIIRAAAADAVNKTVDLYSMVPNPVGMACLAAGMSRDLYQGHSTPGEIIFNTALACGALKGIQLTGKGIKLLYKNGKSVVVKVSDAILNKLHQRRYAAEGRVPFVENPRTGLWTDAAIAEDLALTDSVAYERAWLQWRKESQAPFNVVGHGSPSTIQVDIQGIHPKALNQSNLLRLREEGKVRLNAVQLARLIRTAPGYVKGQHINLFSCECGANSQGIAQQLATRMGVPISAFTEKVFISGNGQKMGTLSTQTGKLGIMKTFYPDTSPKMSAIPLALIPLWTLAGSNTPQSSDIQQRIAHARNLMANGTSPQEIKAQIEQEIAFYEYYAKKFESGDRSNPTNERTVEIQQQILHYKNWAASFGE